MVFNEDLLFLHIPKTGGMKITEELLKNLKGEVYNTVPKGHSPRRYSEKVLLGKRHENLKEAKEFFGNSSLPHRLETFKTILVVIRNPYDLVVSRFFYLKKGHPWDRGIAAKIAMEDNFKKFALEAPMFFKVENYILNDDDQIPSNLLIVRFEDFTNQLNHRIIEFLKAPMNLTIKQNYSKREHQDEYIIDEEIELAIYKNFKFMFDKGYYSRIFFN